MPNERKTFDIHISNELRELLNVIKTESLVASLLLRTTHEVEQLVDSPMNYISISSSDRTKLSYLSTDRLFSIPTNEYWTSSRRYFAKPGAFVTKVFKDIPAKEIEVFSNLFRTHSKKREFELQVVRGEKIREYYFYESYNSDGRGSLGVSCMKHQHCQKYFDLYTDNEDNVSMLAMVNDKGRLIGRALLWDFESHKIMDRIYTQNDEELTFHFKQWATDNGYFYKSEQNWYNSLYFEQLGKEKQELHLSIKLPKGRQHFYPYMDTFKFLDLKTDVITNYIPEDTSNMKILCSSEGGKNNHDYLVLDGIDRVFRYRNDAAFLEYINVWTARQNVIYSNYNDKYILNKDSYYEELIGDYIFNEENFDKNSKRVLDAIDRKKKEKEEYDKRSDKSKTKTKKDLEKDMISSWDTLGAMRGMYDNMYGINTGTGLGGFRTWMDRSTRIRRTSRDAEGMQDSQLGEIVGERPGRPLTESRDPYEVRDTDRSEARRDSEPRTVRFDSVSGTIDLNSPTVTTRVSDNVQFNVTMNDLPPFDTTTGTFVNTGTNDGPIEPLLEEPSTMIDAEGRDERMLRDEMERYEQELYREMVDEMMDDLDDDFLDL